MSMWFRHGRDDMEVFYEAGVTVLRERRGGKVWRSEENRVKQTGKFRPLPTGLFAAPAVLTLDTGDGILTQHGHLVQAPHRDHLRVPCCWTPQLKEKGARHE